MGRWSKYDEQENIIHTDISGIVATIPIVDEVIDEVIELAGTLPSKVFMVVCWRKVKMANASVATHYGNRLPGLLKHIRGIIRYDVSEVASRIVIRSETLKHNVQHSRSHIYATKEEALAAVRSLEQEEEKKQAK